MSRSRQSKKKIQRDTTGLKVIAASLSVLLALVLGSSIQSPAGALIRIQDAGGGGGGGGWPAFDVAVTGLALTSPPVTGRINYSYTVQNFGSRQIVSSWGTEIIGPSGSGGSSGCCVSLAPGQIRIFLGGFQASTPGLYTIRAFADIQGETDSRPYNNQQTIEFTVS